MKHMASETGSVSFMAPRVCTFHLDVAVTASNVAGAPFAEYLYPGDLGRFLGFLACLIQATFTVAGMVFMSCQRCWATTNSAQGPNTFR